MTTKKIYGPWIEWHGGECPVPPDTQVEAKLRCGITEKGSPASDFWWSHVGEGGDIVEYCIVTEQADLDAAAKLLHANGYTVTPPVKPLTFEDVVPMTEVTLEGTQYWFVDPAADDGVFLTQFDNDEYDYKRIKRRMAYLDKEHALIAARHIFGLKGGEL